MLGDELTVLKKSKHLLAKEELGRVRIDVGDRMPRTVPPEDTACDDGMDVRVPLQRRGESLDDGDHPRPGVGLVEGGRHHLADGLVGDARERSEELSVVEEIGSEHLGQRKDPLGTRDVGKNPLVEQ